MSDHRVITFDINKNVDLPKVSSTIRWNTSDVEWDEWANCLAEYILMIMTLIQHIDNIEYDSDFEITVNILISSIRWACEQNLKKI